MIALETKVNRRKSDRHRIPHGAGATATVRGMAGLEGAFALRDVSLSGLSFVVDREIPPLEPGDNLRNVEVRALGHVIRGEMLVMHLSPGPEPGAVCGGLFYPETDVDLLAVRSLVQRLESRPR